MESNIIEIAIFSVALTAIQWISRGTLREALVELATFYRHKDKNEKSILYSVLSLTNNKEYHGLVDEVDQDDEIPQPEIESEHEVETEQLGSLFNDIADLKTHLDNLFVEINEYKKETFTYLTNENLRSRFSKIFVSEESFEKFKSEVVQQNQDLKVDIDESFKELKKFLNLPIIEVEEPIEEKSESNDEDPQELESSDIAIEEEQEIIEQIVEETVEEVVKELEEKVNEEIAIQEILDEQPVTEEEKTEE